MEKLVILPRQAQQQIVERVQQTMRAQGIEWALATSNANIYYLTGRVYSGYVLMPAQGDPVYLVKRPAHLADDRALTIHKPEVMVQALQTIGVTLPQRVALELSSLTYSMATRLIKALDIKEVCDASAVFSKAREVKTPYEIDKIRASGVRHSEVYHRIPTLYQSGMSDIELQVEIERLSRLEGCLGQFRIAGNEMELHMGNILAGDNADAPSPYDFAMGGAGTNPSLPIGANGSLIKPGMAVMVDMNGNFTGYMTDMTRTFAVGTLCERALQAQELSVDICHRLADMARPGTPAKDLYDTALEMARAAGLEDYFMGHRQHAGFVGHGIGIEINELPVLSPRSRDILQAGNVIAIEPKFVISPAGAVGIENTYLVKENGAAECLTTAPEHLIRLD